MRANAAFYQMRISKEIPIIVLPRFLILLKIPGIKQARSDFD